MAAALHVHMIGFWRWLTSLLGLASCAPRVADQFEESRSQHESRARAHQKYKKPHRNERRWGVQKQAIHTAAYFITDPTDYPLKCRGFPGSLRWEVNVSAQ